MPRDSSTRTSGTTKIPGRPTRSSRRRIGGTVKRLADHASLFAVLAGGAIYVGMGLADFLDGREWITGMAYLGLAVCHIAAHRRG